MVFRFKNSRMEVLRSSAFDRRFYKAIEVRWIKMITNNAYILQSEENIRNCEQYVLVYCDRGLDIFFFR